MKYLLVLLLILPIISFANISTDLNIPIGMQFISIRCNSTDDTSSTTFGPVRLISKDKNSYTWGFLIVKYNLFHSSSIELSGTTYKSSKTCTNFSSL